MTLKLLILGDLHLYDDRPSLRQLIGKRLLGHLNLILRRKRRLRCDLLPALIDHALDQQPTALLCTGDLTTTALDSEFKMALAALAPLLKEVPAFILPGNHDRYTFTADRDKRFEQYFNRWTEQRFPAIRIPEPGIHLLGLDPTRAHPINASGRLPQQQLRNAGLWTDALASTTPLIIGCHYPPLIPPALPDERTSHRLARRGPLLQWLEQQHRPILFVHGHVHRPWLYAPPGTEQLYMLNAGAPLLKDARFPCGQGFWILCAQPDQPIDAWRLEHHAMTLPGQWRVQSHRIGEKAAWLPAID